MTKFNQKKPRREHRSFQLYYFCTLCAVTRRGIQVKFFNVNQNIAKGLKSEVGSASHKNCAASSRASTLKICTASVSLSPKKDLRRKRYRKCDVLKSIILIYSFLKLCLAKFKFIIIHNHYSSSYLK